MTIKAFRVRLPLFVGLLLATLLTTSVSLATDQDAFPGQQITQATLRFDDEVLAVAVQGDYAYVGLASGMAILDITNPLQAVVKGVVSGEANDNYTSSIALVRKNDRTQYAVTSGGGSVFRVIDVSNPFVPVRLFSDTFVPGLSDVRDIAVYGEHAFLADAFDFVVMDITVPTLPVIVGRVIERGILRAVDVAPDPATGRVYAYLVGDGYPGMDDNDIGGGLRVIDVTNPSDPQEVWPCSNDNPCPDDGPMNDIVVQGAFAYIAYWQGATITENTGLNIWDISDPANPQHVKNYYTEDSARRVAVASDRAYIVEEDHGDGKGDRLHTIDVADKAQLRGVGLRQLDELYTGSLAASAAQGCVFVPEGAKGLRIVCDTSVTPTPSRLVWLPLLTITNG